MLNKHIHLYYIIIYMLNKQIHLYVQSTPYHYHLDVNTLSIIIYMLNTAVFNSTLWRARRPRSLFFHIYMYFLLYLYVQHSDIQWRASRPGRHHSCLRLRQHSGRTVTSSKNPS